MIRLLDVILSVTAIIFLAPFFFVLSCVIFLEDGFPIFFRQVRVGRAQKLFKIIKFRTMRVDRSGQNEGSVDLELGLQESNKRYLRTQVNDPRITSVGRVLRKYHLDELPQLVNVLVGQMSLVGPRPDTPVQEVEYCRQHWAKRCEVRPGVTGLSQVFSNDQGYTPRRRVALDLLYVNKRGCGLYFWILWMTGLLVLKGPSR